MPKLKWSKEEKTLVVLELLKGGKSVGQLAKALKYMGLSKSRYC